MITQTKRRGRRSLAAILAAMLMASVLAVVAGSPAQAANTSEEALWDHDNDASTPGVRQFAGIDRYDTAYRLAKAYNYSPGGVATVFVASGETLVDAVAVSSMTYTLGAPVLLTPSDELYGNAADYIEDVGANMVYVLGGSAAVADSVITELRDTVGKPTVTRVYGADRYATAAAIASHEMMQKGASWCGGTAAAAILVNGGDVTLADAVAVASIAARLEVPLVLTAHDELPDATADFLRNGNIEHVVIVGGTNSVSDDVKSAVSAIGVDTVDRVGGATSAETSVKLAELAVGSCEGALGSVNKAMAALVRASGSDVPPDGIAAAPYLSKDALVPVLLVGDSLPASVRDYLASTPQTDRNGAKVNYKLLAVGGTAAVSESVMEQAISAAASADALTVSIGSMTDHDGNPNTLDALRAGDQTVRLKFSAPLQQISDARALVRDVLFRGETPAAIAATGPSNTGEAITAIGLECEPQSIDVHLASPLAKGEQVRIVGGQARIGSQDDLRTVAGASVTVVAAPADTVGPTLRLYAVEDKTDGTSPARLEISDAKKDNADTPALGSDTGDQAITAEVKGDTSTTNTNEYVRGEMRITRSGNTALTLSNVASVTAGAAAGMWTATLSLTDSSDEFEAYDRIVIDTGALVDDDGNKSRPLSATVETARALPRVQQIRLSAEKHLQAQQHLDATLTGQTAAARNMTIKAKPGSSADGAYGNAWSFRFDRASVASGFKTTDPVRYSVTVNTAATYVSVRLLDGSPTFADLKKALDGNTVVAANFTVTLNPQTDNCGTRIDKTSLTADVATSVLVTMVGGETGVAVEVSFDGMIRQLGTADAANNTGAALLADVLAAAGKRVNPADAAAGLTAATTSFGTVDAGFTGPHKIARFALETANHKALPQPRDVVMTAADVAVGYADDITTTTADERQNAAQNRLISRSTSVRTHTPTAG